MTLLLSVWLIGWACLAIPMYLYEKAIKGSYSTWGMLWRTALWPVIFIVFPYLAYKEIKQCLNTPNQK